MFSSVIGYKYSNLYLVYKIIKPLKNVYLYIKLSHEERLRTPVYLKLLNIKFIGILILRTDFNRKSFFCFFVSIHFLETVFLALTGFRSWKR